MIAENPGPLSVEQIKRIFTEIISACRALEHMPRVAFLGPELTYSHDAARLRFGSSVAFVPESSIAGVFQAARQRPRRLRCCADRKFDRRHDYAHARSADRHGPGHNRRDPCCRSGRRHRLARRRSRADQENRLASAIARSVPLLPPGELPGAGAGSDRIQCVCRAASRGGSGVRRDRIGRRAGGKAACA